jgi:hypothetical protein
MGKNKMDVDNTNIKKAKVTPFNGNKNYHRARYYSILQAETNGAVMETRNRRKLNVIHGGGNAINCCSLSYFRSFAEVIAIKFVELLKLHQSEKCASVISCLPLALFAESVGEV